ncbi:MAG: SDR family NAD(P)-dependent oxidoreductase [Chloroflexi bacterium]|nr:SDR family NAD(P)-dependent oxidoreductase [Chloroflexota bacterium]
MIDIAPGNNQTAHQLLAECAAPSLMPIVALRGRQRWLPTIIPSPLRETAVPAFNSDGSYLITGGLSDIGYDIARTIAEKTAANLVLLDEVAASEAQLAELETAGSAVLTLSVNLTDVVEMRTAVSQAIEHFGQINGVIHSPTIAGQQAFQSIAEITPMQSDIFFRTKLTSLAVLAEVIAKLPLDFCLVSSALSTVLGGVGFAAFTAAAHSANAAVHCLNQSSTFPWLTLNWDVWAFEKENALPGLGDLAKLALNRQEGFEVLTRAIGMTSSGQDNVLISTANLPQRIAERQQKDAVSDRNLYERPEMWTEYIAPRNEIEARVVAIWQQVLGIEKIGVEDNFFDLGGHSLLATQLRNQLYNEFQVELSFAAVVYQRDSRRCCRGHC